jgi:hypothetical protein
MTIFIIITNNNKLSAIIYKRDDSNEIFNIKILISIKCDDTVNPSIKKPHILLQFKTQ